MLEIIAILSYISALTLMYTSLARYADAQHKKAQQHKPRNFWSNVQ